MTTVWLRVRADVRGHWRALLGLALLLGVVGGVVLTATAGARRTDTAYPRLLSWANAAGVTVIVTNSEAVRKPPAGTPADRYFVAGGRAAAAVRKRYFSALAGLPRVASVSLATEYDMALPAPGGIPDPGVQVFASPDGSLGVTGDRVKITAGRMFEPAARGAAVIDAELATREHLRPGDTLHLIGIPKDADGTADLKLAVALRFRVTGIAVFDDQVVPTTAATAFPRVLLSPAFAATDLAVSMTNLPEAAVRLSPGASTTKFLTAADELRATYGIAGADYAAVTLADQVTATERAIRPQALALAIFAALTAVIGLAVTGQLLARQLAADAADFPVLRALGATRNWLAAEALARLALATVTGAVIAACLAVAASPLMPIGQARLAEPHPGTDADLPVLAVGFAVIALLPLAVLAPVAWRAAGRVAGWPGQPGRGAAGVSGPARQPRLSAALGQVGSVTCVAGARMAFERGQGRAAVPVRTAVAGTAVAIGAVVAAVIFGTSLHGLVGTPGRYGQNWSAEFDTGYADIPSSAGARLLAGVGGIAGYAAGNNGELSVDGRNVPAIGIDPLRGGGAAYLTMLAGRAPSGANEIALGAQTLRALHKTIGQTVKVRVSWRGGVAGPPTTSTMRITGTAVLPAFGVPAMPATDLGIGAVVATSLLSGTTAATGCDGRVTCYNFLLLRYRPGTGRAATAAALLTRAARVGCPPGQCTVTDDQRPGDITNYASIRDTPLVLGVVLALLAIATLAHVLLTSVRRRRRDLAVLKTLGMTRTQVAGVVGWHAAALVLAALLIGLPGGIIAGRLAWGLFADTAGVSRQPVIAISLLASIAAAALLLAVAIAAWPAWAAARLRTAAALRAE
jgi:hypothetical protein